MVWLRNPALRTAELCNRTVLWSLQTNGLGAWDVGQFYDPENGSTYHVPARQQSEDLITARVYAEFAWLGETVSMLRIQPNSLNGWRP